MAERPPLSVNFDLSPIIGRPFLGLRWACGRVCGLVSLGGREARRAPQARILRNEDQEQEFQYGNTQCLARYYSVFAARLAIMVMLAILIGMLTILTWHFTRVYTTKSINSLAYGLRFELLQRPILRMWNILNSTSEITVAQVKLSEYVIGRYAKPTTHRQSVELYEVMRDVTWALFASRKALTAITISYRNGYVQAFHRDHGSNSTFYIYSVLVNSSHSNNHEMEALESHGWHNRSTSGNDSAIWYQEQLDPVTGENTGIQRQIPPENLINIAGISEIHDGAASWHVAVSKFTDSPLLSAALPVRHPSDGSIMAVVGVTTALYSVGQLMRELVEFHSGYMYLTSQEGYLLATSTDAPLVTNSTGGPKLMMAVDSEDPIIRLGAEWLQKTYGDKLSLNHEVHVENVMIRHQNYYIDSFFLNLKRLPLVGVIIMPRKYIMGRIDQRAFTTLVILISASVCILAIGCVCIMILTTGVSKEMKLRAELISQLDARRRAEASSNYKSQFLANMSHELRTPLAGIIGLLDILLCDDCLTNEQIATVSQIRKCSTALLRLLNNILDLSKVESGKLVLEEAEFDLGRELEGLVDMFSVQCIDHNVETVLDLSDDMPKLVQGDSARVVQIFANLISNSIKFTSSGHIILRGWCERSSAFNKTKKTPPDNNKPRAAQKMKLKQTENLGKRSFQKDSRITLWFEVEDTGCGIDPSKWESVFESFEQADPSTTRMYGGTGLGLCIVHTLVNKMGGEIKVVKKEGPGTLMQLCLVFSTPTDGSGQCHQIEFGKKSLMVLLAVNGSKGRFIMSQWLRGKGVHTCEASEWNELTQILQKVFQPSRIEDQTKFLPNDLSVQDTGTLNFVIVIDLRLLDLSTDIWKEQLNFLDKYHSKAKFAWVLNHDTANAIKMELRKKGHLLMVNRPLYKSKLIQILEVALGEIMLECERGGNSLECSISQLGSNECFEIDPVHFNAGSFDDSDTFDAGSCNSRGSDFLVGETKERNCGSSIPGDDLGINDNSEERNCFASSKVGSNEKSLEGLCILLAEDTPVLQRVATIMLEKMGATVVAVGDGLQAVDALKCFNGDGCKRESSMNHDGEGRSQRQFKELPPFDLVLMDCQMPKLDGYEATKAIRSSEAGSGSHIPIVALTAHAMSSDEAKCLKVGMDAYLTKPIDSKQMVSTILSLTKCKV